MDSWFFVSIMSNKNMARRRLNLESMWFAFGNEGKTATIVLPQLTQIVLQQLLWIKYNFFALKNILFIVGYGEHEIIHSLQPLKLLNIIFNEIFEINNLNQIWNNRKELWFHESFYEANKNKRVCCFELFGQVAKKYVYVFMND